jgi:hypothetical protein
MAELPSELFVSALAAAAAAAALCLLVYFRFLVGAVALLVLTLSVC